MMFHGCPPSPDVWGRLSRDPVSNIYRGTATFTALGAGPITASSQQSGSNSASHSAVVGEVRLFFDSSTSPSGRWRLLLTRRPPACAAAGPAAWQRLR